MNKKNYYIYKEFENEFGWNELHNITRVFEDIEKLFEYMNERKQFYDGKWYKRKIEIEILGDKE